MNEFNVHIIITARFFMYVLPTHCINISHHMQRLGTALHRQETHNKATFNAKREERKKEKKEKRRRKSKRETLNKEKLCVNKAA